MLQRTKPNVFQGKAQRSPSSSAPLSKDPLNMKQNCHRYLNFVQIAGRGRRSLWTFVTEIKKKAKKKTGNNANFFFFYCNREPKLNLNLCMTRTPNKNLPGRLTSCKPIQKHSSHVESMLFFQNILILHLKKERKNNMNL